MKLIAAAALGVASALPMLAAAEGDLTCPIRPGHCIPLPEEGTFYDGRGRVVEGVATLLPAEVTFCILARAETNEPGLRDQARRICRHDGDRVRVFPRSPPTPSPSMVTDSTGSAVNASAINGTRSVQS